MYSQERRRERYQIIFIWKISQGLVQGYNLTFTNSDRRGRTAVPHAFHRQTPAAVRRARESSLGVKGVCMFNLLPVWLRTMSGVPVDKFKEQLDGFLSAIPDEPTIPGRARAASSNSLIDQIQLYFG